MAQIFISHSKEDRNIKSFFEGIFAVTKVRAVFVEYESYQPPPGPYIQRQINESKAMFLLLGQNVERLSHTKVWIGSETGIAQQANKAIWVFEPFGEWRNVPIPYVLHYVPYIESDQAFQYIKDIVNSYDDSAAIEAVIRGAGLGAGAGATLVEEAKRSRAAIIGAVMGAVFESWRTDPSRTRPVGIPVTCANPSCRSTYRVHGSPEVFPCPVCRERLQVDWASL
jgi:hypothetical protein